MLIICMFGRKIDDTFCIKVSMGSFFRTASLFTYYENETCLWSLIGTRSIWGNFVDGQVVNPLHSSGISNPHSLRFCVHHLNHGLKKLPLMLIKKTEWMWRKTFQLTVKGKASIEKSFARVWVYDTEVTANANKFQFITTMVVFV